MNDKELFELMSKAIDAYANAHKTEKEIKDDVNVICDALGYHDN